jgi:hypothetical protein
LFVPKRFPGYSRRNWQRAIILSVAKLTKPPPKDDFPIVSCGLIKFWHLPRYPAKTPRNLPKLKEVSRRIAAVLQGFRGMV